MEHLLTVAQLGQMRVGTLARLKLERVAHRKAERVGRLALAAIIAENVTAMEAALDALDALLDGSGASAKISLVEGD